MTLIFSIFLSFTFTCISALHFYWALGGKKGFEEALPTDENGKRVLNPRKSETLVVAFGLLLFAFFYLYKAGVFQFGLHKLAINFGGWIISSIFILRSIGEFKYVGFFKRIRNTGFGIRDTKYYSPLCLLIGGIGFLLEIL